MSLRLLTRAVPDAVAIPFELDVRGTLRQAQEVQVVLGQARELHGTKLVERSRRQFSEPGRTHEDDFVARALEEHALPLSI